MSHEHGHGHASSRWAAVRHRVGHLLTPHSHDAGDKVDTALESSKEGSARCGSRCSCSGRPPPCNS